LILLLFFDIHLPTPIRASLSIVSVVQAYNQLLHTVKIVVPMHWGTFPALAGTPQVRSPLIPLPRCSH
jgi:hypothetical protein